MFVSRLLRLSLSGMVLVTVLCLVGCGRRGGLTLPDDEQAMKNASPTQRAESTFAPKVGIDINAGLD